jgi:5-guanidino-2-oxopentanoate decarboxylase
MTAMGQAYSDSVPMLVISSCLDETSARRGQLHQMKDQRAAAETVCDWSEEARTAEAAYALIDRALVEFQTKRARPKHIQVPIALAGALASGAGEMFALGSKSTVDGAQVQQLAARINKAQKPLFVFGGGCASLECSELATLLLKKTGAAAFTSYAGRGVVHPEYPLLFGSALAKPSSADVFKQADLVVVFGSELAEVDIWRDHLGNTCPLVRVDIDPEELADDQRCTLAVHADAFAVLLALVECDFAGGAKWEAGFVRDARARWRAQTDSDRTGIVPILDALRAALPETTTVYSDMTQFAYVAKEIWDMPAPNLWHHPFGFGTLGYAMPAAIGGKIGLGDKPVIAIAGDYGFQYTVQELGVAVELGLSLPIIVWDNGKLKEIEDCMINSQIAPNAVQALNPNFCKLAEAWGAYSAHPKSLSEMQDAVRAALKADGPTLIYVTPEIL